MIEKKNLQAPDCLLENGSTSSAVPRWKSNGWTQRRARRVDRPSLATSWRGWWTGRFRSKLMGGLGRQRYERLRAEATKSCIGLTSASMAISPATIPSRPATRVPHESSQEMYRRSPKLNRGTARSIDVRRRVWCQLETTRPGKGEEKKVGGQKVVTLEGFGYPSI